MKRPRLLALGLALLAASASARGAGPKPTKRVFGVPDVMQVNSWSCGAAAVQAVAQRFGHWGYQEPWARELGTSSEEGTHPRNMVQGLRELGLEAELVEGMTLDELRGHMDRGDVVIVDFQAWGEPLGKDYSKEWEDGHYGVAVGYSKKHLFIEDPSLLGTVGYLTFEDFESRWHDYENEDGRRREYRHMAIVVRGPRPWQPRYTPID